MEIFTTVWALAYIIVFAGLSVYGLHRYQTIYLYLKYRKKEPVPREHFQDLPVVTVQLPIYNELYVVERLIQAVGRLDYPKQKLEIQILDDSTDETQELVDKQAALLKQQGLNARVIRRPDRHGFKAGALDFGLLQAKGEFIFILDADFVPNTDILQKTIHFFTDPAVGMIQSRWGHLNRNYNLLTKIQAMFLDGHLLLEQTARSRSGRFFNFNGTAGIWRRSCIEAAGGWQHDTLTEDLDLSYRAQIQGWRFVFLPNLITPAELPVDINGFKSQQHRWTKGSIQTCKKLLGRIWASPLPLPVKIEATLHLTSNFTYLLLALLCFLLFPSEFTPLQGPWRFLLLDLPVFFAASLSVLAFYFVAQRELYPKTWMKEMIWLPFLLALGIGLSLNNSKAVLEAMFNHQSEFKRTPKYGIGGQRKNWRALRYSKIVGFLPLLELGLAAYFLWCITIAVLNGSWGSLPFLMIFLFGFSYVAFSSFAIHLPRWRFGANDDSDGEAAVA